MKGIVIGFPKSGTTTIDVALRKSGLRTANQRIESGWCGRLMYRRHFNGEDPFADFVGYDVITQADICSGGANFWPNLDIPMLLSIRRRHPDCLFILNVRDPADIVSSISLWTDLRERIVAADIIGLPKGYGDRDSHLIEWIENHYAACRAVFKNDEKFLDLNISDVAAPQLLGEALGVEIKWWGVANKNSASRRRYPSGLFQL